MSKLKKLLPLSTRLVLITVLSLLFAASFALVVMADSAGPALSGFSPYPNSKAGAGSFKVSFRAYDADRIALSATIKVNGATVAATVTYDPAGYWDEEGYFIPTGTDYNGATITSASIASSTLKDEGNTAWVSIKDQAGNESTYQWNFKGPNPPVVSQVFPTLTAPNDTPVISAVVTDNGIIDAASIKLKIGQNGANYTQVNHSFNPFSGVVSYIPPGQLASGGYSIWLEVSDTVGNKTNKFWNFSIPPAISAFSPAKTSSIANLLPEIAAWVGPVGRTVDPGKIILKVNGVKVNHTWAQNYVRYRPTTLLPGGRNDVNLEVTTTDGYKYSASWYFNIKTSPNITFSAPVPSTGIVTNSWYPQVSVYAQSNTALLADPVYILLDGVRYNAQVNWVQTGQHWGWIADYEGDYEGWIPDYDTTKGTITFLNNSTPMLTDGPHTISVSVADGTGAAGYTWSFEVQAAPQLSQLTPVPGSTVSTLRPVISAKITENSAIASVKMLVDGVEVPVANDFVTGVVSGHLSKDLLNDTDHTVQVIVTDVNGNTESKTWTFGVQIYPEMPIASCTSCHSKADHPQNNCSACHAVYQPETKTYSSGKIEACWTCHSWGTQPHPYRESTWGHQEQPTPLNCTDCHQPANPAVPQQHLTDNNFHKSSTDMTSCKTCHVQSLTREHFRYTNSTTNKQNNCDTCHKSTDPKVQQAITNNQTNCNACHTLAGHDALHKSGLDDACQTCHKDALTQEHLNNSTTQTDPVTGLVNQFNCDTCHASTGNEIKRTVAANSLYCAGCHNSGHDVVLADKIPADIPLYTGFHWSSPNEASLFTGEPGTPAGYDGGQVVLSNRRNDVSSSDVWNFYHQELTANQWALKNGEPAAGTTFFSAEFTKDSRAVTVKFFNTARSDGTGQTQASGFRIELWYK